MELLIGIIIGFFIGLKWRKNREGVDAINDERHRHKEESLERIKGLFDHHDSITNNQVENLLGVSDTTATNYLNELEKQGKIVRVGDEGRGVSYRKAERST